MRFPQSGRKVVYILCGTLSVVDDLCEVLVRALTLHQKQRTRVLVIKGDSHAFFSHDGMFSFL